MKKNFNIAAYAILALLFSSSCTHINVQTNNQGATEIIDLNNKSNSDVKFVIDFKVGKSHNHPLMAVWAEDAYGNYLETFFVSQSIGKGIFDKATGGGGKWLPGPVRRPASLPYWAHKRGVKEADGLYIPTPQTPITDAIAGATPKHNFRLIATPTVANFPKKFHLLFEINQSWDWNAYWSNEKFADQPEYKTSCQPSVIYDVFVNLESQTEKYYLNPIGHGHYAGKTGALFTDLSTLTSALEIAKEVTVTIKK